MKTAFFLDTTEMNDDTLSDFIKYIGAAREIICPITPFDVREKQDKLLLIALIDKGTINLDLWSYYSLARFGTEGYKLVSARSKEHFIKELVRGDYKYCK